MTELVDRGANADADGSVDYDVVVVGAGQAGLAIGYFLARAGRRFVILDGAASVGAAWRARWDSLVLFTPRRYDNLPGLPFPGDPDGYPTRDEVIEYLERYAATFELPVQLASRVRSLSRTDAVYTIELDGRSISARQVVVATGAFQAPRIPDFADRLSPDVVQLHSTGYRSPSSLPDGVVLVVGGGNTGFQIARELSETRDAHLAVGSRQTPFPQRILGRDLFWWLIKLGLLSPTVNSRLGRRLRERDTLIGTSPRSIERVGVELRPRATAASGKHVSFADGSELEVDAVVWATGFRADHAWIDVPSVHRDGLVQHERGVTESDGLYFLGLPWQHTRGSALLGWVAADAAYVADRIAASVRR